MAPGVYGAVLKEQYPHRSAQNGQVQIRAEPLPAWRPRV